MTKKSFSVALFVSLAVSSLPLACGDDEASPTGDDTGSGGSAAEATGGKGGGGSSSGGKATGGSSGKATGGSGGKATGGSGGKATGGVSSGGTGGEAGAGGTDGGVGGASDGGAGGEGGVDEATARCQRICEKTEWLMCPDSSGCAEGFCNVLLNDYPYCRPYADAVLICLDERATPEEFACWQDQPGIIFTPESTCRDEISAAVDAGC